MPSGGGGAGGGGEALPLGAAGLVDVDVRVNQAGEQCVLAEIVTVVYCAGCVGFSDANDLAGAGVDDDGGGANLVGEYDTSRYVCSQRHGRG